MRRKDREITDQTQIDAIIRGCHCCRLAFCDQGEAYIVPLNFGYVNQNGLRRFYFHSAKEGRKLDLIAQRGRAGFELDRGYELHRADKACGHSASFQSVIGTGAVSFVTDPAEREDALQAIMAQTAGEGTWTFAPQMLDVVCIFRLDVEELSCKVHL